MTQEGTSGFGNNSSLLQQTLSLRAGPGRVGGNVMTTGRQLAGSAVRPGSYGRPAALGARPNPAPANRGQPYGQRPGQFPGARVNSTSITSTEGESGGEHDAANFTYTIVPWNQNAHESVDVHKQTHLEPGDFVFVQTLVVEQFVLYNMLNIAQLNTALRDNTIVHKTRVAKGNPDAVRFQGYMDRYGDHWLCLYVQHRERNTLKEFRELFDTPAMAEKAISELKDMAKMAVRKNYYSLTRYGVRATWNFVGCVLTTSDPLRMKGIQQYGYSRVLSVNVTVKGNFEAALQLWAGQDKVPAQSKLFFVTTRVITERGPGPFQLIPYGSRTRESIPRALITYRDDAGFLCQGCCTYIGGLHLPPNREPPQAMRLVAAGLIPETPHMQREAGAQLTRHNGQMRIQIGIF